MHFTPLTIVALAGSAYATWVIEEPASYSAKDSAQVGELRWHPAYLF